MGSPKFSKKKYNTPLHPWKEERIESEREIIKKYGLKNHKEVWKAKTYLGRYRQQARELLAKIGGKDPHVKKESEQLLLHLTRMGILPQGSSLDDVLALEIESILSRRLQTLVFLKGFSTTTNQSRQLINHGHIAIGDRKVTIPSYIVSKDKESEIGYTNISPLNELSHPARPKAETFKTSVDTFKIEKTEEETVDTKKEEDSENKTIKEKSEKKKEKSSEDIKESKIEINEKKDKKTEEKEKIGKDTIDQEKKSNDTTEEKSEKKESPPDKKSEKIKNENKGKDNKKEENK